MSSTGNSFQSKTPSANYLAEKDKVYYKSQFVGIDNDPGESECLFCDLSFILPTNEKDYLSHLFEKHRLVIGDVKKIASLRSYAHYWKARCKNESLINFCTTMLMDCTPDGKPSKGEIYYLLSDCIAEDKTLRDEIQSAKLEWVLNQQTYERTDTNFKRGCIICKQEFSGLRITYLTHLKEKHHIQFGKYHNLVFVDKLLDKIQYNFDNFICIYCEKVFKDRNVLKEHMRKKLHKCINPRNKSYDEFYITNYVKLRDPLCHKEDNEFDDEYDAIVFSDNEDEENLWSDWTAENNPITCLFCTVKIPELSTMLDHMKDEHDFDFNKLTENLNFYEKIKLVNYFRKQVHEKKCVFCDQQSDDCLQHMKNQDHFKIPPARIWNLAKYYSPMCKEDPFLYHLDTGSDDECDESNIDKLSDDIKNL
ncbi:zinc finger protein 277 isoform X1 [Cotesia glomerata]|uniref:C2H2-type domain-containing protein n=1 Tax=Cotesia glomerata TaxID=32391 RepID=A0AAV7HWN7_COTGL|nr:zinc finger protein 277 isoform X1 [Cotesia glomerata]KAH0539277.1 hypothetical protein KQX54_003463 [Cotesia glomerata]